jgi:hypothetical protein
VQKLSLSKLSEKSHDKSRHGLGEASGIFPGYNLVKLLLNSKKSVTQ